MARRAIVEALLPYNHDELICVNYELEFRKDVIKPGDKLKFKNKRGTFQFRFWVHNARLDKTWIDCTDITTGEFRAFWIADLKGVIRPKKSRAKKIGK